MLECEELCAKVAVDWRAQQRFVGYVLRMSLRYAVKRGLVTRYLFADEPLSVPPVRFKQRTIPTAAEVELFLRTLVERGPKEKHYAHIMRVPMMLLALRQGLRAGEITAIHWENIDFEEGRIRLTHGFNRYDGLKDDLKTLKSKRSFCTIDPALGFALGKLWEERGRPQQGLVFVTINGTPVNPDLISRGFLQIMKRAGMVIDNGTGKRPQTVATQVHPSRLAPLFRLEPGQARSHAERHLKPYGSFPHLDDGGHLHP